MDVQMFEVKLAVFWNDTDSALQLFIEYFKETYAVKAKYWAYYYRIGVKINTNAVTESFQDF